MDCCHTLTSASGGQVEALTRRQQTQEKELQRSSLHAQNAMTMAGEETAKSRAAKEVIKSLTAQVWHRFFP